MNTTCTQTKLKKCKSESYKMFKILTSTLLTNKFPKATQAAELILQSKISTWTTLQLWIWSKQVSYLSSCPVACTLLMTYSKDKWKESSTWRLKILFTKKTLHLRTDVGDIPSMLLGMKLSSLQTWLKHLAVQILNLSLKNSSLISAQTPKKHNRCR